MLRYAMLCCALLCSAVVYCFQGIAKVQQVFNLGGKVKGSRTVAGLMVSSGSLKSGGSSLGGGIFKGQEYVYR